MATNDRPNRSSHFSSDGPDRRTAPRPTMRTTGVSNRSAQATRRAAAHVREPRHRKGSKIVPSLIGLAIVALLAFVAIRFVLPNVLGSDSGSSGSQVTPGQVVQVTIPEGSGAGQIAQALYDAGVIDSTSDFLAQVKRMDVESQLKSGTYDFVAGTDLRAVIDLLTKGPNASSLRLTIPEGYTLTKVAAQVETSLGIPSDTFLAQAKASTYVADYLFLAAAQDDSLEGFLFPKTYDFSGQEPTADLVIRAMLNQYQTEMASIDFASGEAAIKERYGVDMTDYDILVMASIIEREAVTEEDRPLVSSVFYNRLNAGMPLQSDATMGYVTGGEVTPDDLRQDSPYNTYLNNGLTPTPICCPSIESINAALNPADTDYFYFLIIENGSYSNHTFSETYAQHEAAIAEANAASA